LVFTSEKENLSEQKLRQLQEALSKARADRIQKQSRFETASSVSPETLPEVLDDTALRDYQAKLTDLRRQRAELAMNFTPAFPKLKQTDAQITTLESALEKSRTAIIKRIRTEYEDARRREELMAKDFSEQSRLVSAEAQKVVQYNILKREVDTHRQIYEAMLQRVKEAGIASAMKASNVRVVDSAKPPERPYQPNVPLQTTVGLLAGLSLGAAVLVGHERRDRTLRQPGDVSFHLALPELGAVPSSRHSGASHRKSNGHNGSRVSPLPIIEIASPGSAGSAGKGGIQRECIELAAWQQQLSRVAVAFRAVRTSILFSGQNGRHPRVLVVTSPSAAEGKTTVATNLAVTLAGSQRRVLLIDGDLRRSRLHDLFGLSSDYGLADLLDDGPATCLTGLEYVIQRTAVPGLYVLASGPAPANATDLLDSRSMSELVKQTRKAFDMIVFDTPPVLELPDARILGRVADAVILVVRAGKTTRDAGLAAKRQLQADGSLVLGTILNDWDADGHGSGYRYYAYREG
jgi:capsular exopolysaccharide synthesis family protein